jgi:hypothetical protein
MRHGIGVELARRTGQVVRHVVVGCPRLIGCVSWMWRVLDRGVGILLGIGYANQGCCRRLRARFCKPRVFASSGGCDTRTELVGIVWGCWLCEPRVFASIGAGIHEVRLWHHQGARLHETRVLTLFGGWDTRTEAAGIVWDVGYANPRCFVHVGLELVMNLFKIKLSQRVRGMSGWNDRVTRSATHLVDLPILGSSLAVHRPSQIVHLVPK